MSSCTCSYCGTVLGTGPDENTGKAFCGFCEMDVKPSVNGERINRQSPIYLSADMKNDPMMLELEHLPTRELMEHHTLTLLQVLKYMREERRSMFESMTFFKKGASEDPQLSELARDRAEMYELITRKCYAVENIIKDRMGYIPKKITNELLLSYQNRCLDPDNMKPMIVRRSEEEREVSPRQGLTR